MEIIYSEVDMINIMSQILEMCKDKNRIPTYKEIYDKKIIGDVKILDRYVCSLSYDSWHDYFRDKGFGSCFDYMINGRFKKCETVDDIIFLYNDFASKHNGFPTTEDLYKRNNLPTHGTIMSILKKNGLTLNDFYKLIGNEKLITDKKDYDKYVQRFIEVSNKIGRAIRYRELACNEWELPNGKWLVKNCPNNIKNYGEFLVYCGFLPNNKMSKEIASKIILDIATKLDRPLKYDDFRSQIGGISISIINRIWGSLNKMKQDLGLEIIQEDMTSKQKSIQEVKNDIVHLCNIIYQTENRKIICKDDIDKCEFSLNYLACDRYLKREYKQGLRGFLKFIGFDLVKAGRGLVYYYPDGEVVLSQFERIFSDCLRSVGLKYNRDYFRDVKYKTFTNKCKRNYDCDYIIKHNNKTLYIEIAGVLRDCKQAYIDNTPLQSNSREKYRLSLMKKEKLLKDNKLNYYILFPSDLQEDFLLSILN